MDYKLHLFSVMLRTHIKQHWTFKCAHLYVFICLEYAYIFLLLVVTLIFG